MSSTQTLIALLSKLIFWHYIQKDKYVLNLSYYKTRFVDIAVQVNAFNVFSKIVRIKLKFILYRDNLM